MSGVVVFDYTAWALAYPEFTVTQAQAEACFETACLYCNNGAGAIVPYNSASTPPVTTRRTLLYLLTAHIAQLQYGSGGAEVSPLVGRVNSASEGTVSVGADMPGVTANSAWFMQTKYGASYWQATARWRTMRYVPGPPAQYNGAPVPFGQGAYLGGFGSGYR